MKQIDIDLLKDPRSSKIISTISNYLCKKIVSAIELEFTSLEKFLKFRTLFGIYAKKAQTQSLTYEEAKHFTVMRTTYNKAFGIDFETIRKLNKQFRYKGKIIRLPTNMIDYVLLNRYKIKAINNGKAFINNYHWTKKYVAKDETMYKFLWNKYHKEQFSVLVNKTPIEDSIDDLVESLEV